MNSLHTNFTHFFNGRLVIVSLIFTLLLLLVSACSEEVLPVLPQSEAEQTANEISENGLDNQNDPPETADDSTTNIEKYFEIPYIGIYNGKGSWDVNVDTFINFFESYNYTWSEFDEQDILSVNMTDLYDLIWFPGGFAAEYKNFIKEQENIREFVANGGMFAGSCAGAYYASDILRWFGEDHPYPLKFFPGKAIGPLSGQIAWGEIAEFELNPAIGFNQNYPSSLPFYYFDGPYFSPIDEEDPDIVVLARYVVNKEPAIIAGRYGQGKYLLIGPHPELGGYSSASPDFNVDGGEGAHWDWLNAALHWFIQW